MAMPEDHLVGVYQYFSPAGGTAAYYLLYLMGPEGLIEPEVMQKTYAEMFFSSQRKMDERWGGPFEGLENLQQFVLRLCVQLDIGRAHLWATTDFNQLVENTATATELLPLLIERGHTLENLDKAKRKKGLLGKIFN
ncbi:MAG: hypothetical protein J6Y94_04060 [Bacteriovoracaceae bacterium]|nr:hypothetical protein [Bacteriovoracaceae bacterium]